MSDPGSHAADAPGDVSAQSGVHAHPATAYAPEPLAERPRSDAGRSPAVSSGAQQYGQPPATGYLPPAADPPGQSAPVQGHGPQQYGQPEHGQTSYAQEGFPSAGAGRSGFQPTGAAHAQQPDGGQQPYEGAQPYVPRGQPPYPGQQPYAQPYPPQPYPPRPYAVQQRPLSESDQRLWTTLTHLSIPFFGFVGPLVAYLVLKDRSLFLRSSTTEALNFSIVFSIALTASSILTAVVIGIVLLPVVWIVAVVLCVLAALRANRGEVYRYPLSWRLVT